MRLIKGNVERICKTEAQVSKLKAEGFKVIGDVIESGKAEEKNLAEMKVSELRELAKEKGLEGYASLNKEELLKVLKDVV